MAIIGFIFCFLGLCYATVFLFVCAIGQEFFSGTFGKVDIFAYILGAVLVGLGWYHLLKDVTISVGGI